eukprot:evm.model.NODE_1514_length_7963_cov_49.755493.3
MSMSLFLDKWAPPCDIYTEDARKVADVQHVFGLLLFNVGLVPILHMGEIPPVRSTFDSDRGPGPRVNVAGEKSRS